MDTDNEDKPMPVLLWPFLVMETVYPGTCFHPRDCQISPIFAVWSSRNFQILVFRY